jgi:hypothetical protein
VSDVFDQAQERDIQQLQEALQVQQERAKAVEQLLPIGECRNPLCCEGFDASEPQRLFCGPPCAQEYARRLK